MRSQIEISVATNARPNHRAACAQISVMVDLDARLDEYVATKQAARMAK
jgi:hypothetical protein